METLPPTTRPASPTLKGGILVSAIVLLGGFLMLVMIPGSSGQRPAQARTECRRKLGLLAMAMHNYHDTYGTFPPAYLADKDGRPMHSWRILLLPFLGHRDLYERYRFDEPWNGPNNRKLGGRMPPEFHCPADVGAEAHTSYFVVVGPKTIFPGAVPVPISDISDGTVNTILLVEAADREVNWLEPKDLTYEEGRRGINAPTDRGISSHHNGGAMVAFADGSRELLPDQIPLQQLQLLLERNDGRPGSMHRPPVAATAR